MLVLGNIIALIAAILMACVGIIKSKKKILIVQSIQIGLFVISNFLLNGISGAIINIISFIRNILCYKDILGIKEKIVLTILSVVLTIIYNNHGLIGYMPLIGMTVYLWLMNTKDIIKFKLLIIFTIICWAVYDFTIKSYTSCAFDLLGILTNLLSINKIQQKK